MAAKQCGPAFDVGFSADGKYQAVPNAAAKAAGIVPPTPEQAAAAITTQAAATPVTSTVALNSYRMHLKRHGLVDDSEWNRTHYLNAMANLPNLYRKTAAVNPQVKAALTSGALILTEARLLFDAHAMGKLPDEPKPVVVRAAAAASV